MMKLIEMEPGKILADNFITSLSVITHLGQLVMEDMIKTLT